MSNYNCPKRVFAHATGRCPNYLTYANVDDLYEDIGFKPSTSLEVGIDKFVHWDRDFYQV